LSSIIDEIEVFGVVRTLTAQEIELRNKSNTQLTGILREEELKCYKRSKAQFILEGIQMQVISIASPIVDMIKLTHSVVRDESAIEGHEQLKSYITNYYKVCSRIKREPN
jgi:hypothetical protein